MPAPCNGFRPAGNDITTLSRLQMCSGGNRGEFAQTDAYMSTVEKSEGIGIAVGIAVGVPIGMIFDSVGAGIGIGIAMAIAAGLVLKR
jgi:hypothetical protein